MQSHSFSIVSLGVKDAADVAFLEAALFALPWSEKQYRQMLEAAAQQKAQGNCPFFQVFGVHTPDARLAAYISVLLHTAAGELEVCNIATDPAFRRQGIGGRLLDHALALAGKKGMERAVLEVREHNHPAIALYQSRHFVLCGRRKAYYSDSGEDALVLECVFARTPSPKKDFV